MNDKNYLKILYTLPFIGLLVYGVVNNELFNISIFFILITSLVIIVSTIIYSELFPNNIVKLTGLSTMFLVVYSSRILLFDRSTTSLFTISMQYFYLANILFSGSILYGLFFVKNNKTLSTLKTFNILFIISLVMIYLLDGLSILDSNDQTRTELLKMVFISVTIFINVVNIIKISLNDSLTKKEKIHLLITVMIAISALMLSFFDFVFGNILLTFSLISVSKLIIIDNVLSPYTKNVLLLEEKSRELNSLIRVDKLTQLPNREEVFEMYDRVLRFSKREKQTIVVIMLDIDDFTFYNNKFGMAHGDSVLVRIANAIKKECKRPLDIVGRAGGDEFFAVLPNSDFKGGRIVANRIEKAIRDLRIVHYKHEDKFLSVSIGFISITPNQDTKNDYPTNQAQAQMNKIKNTGKNSILGIDLDKGE